MEKSFFVGVDPGGSKCETIVSDTKGNICGFGRADFTDIPSDVFDIAGKGRNMDVVSLSIKRAFANLFIDEVVACGNYSAEGLEQAIASCGIKKIRAYHIKEYTAMCALGHIDYGYCVLAGTGAFSAMVLPDGRNQYLDALGPNIGDFGSGYSIGYAAAKAVVKSEWDKKYETLMSVPINRRLLGKENNNQGFDFLDRFYKMPDRSEIASLAAIVNECAGQGDKIAINILQRAGEDLGETALCLINNIACVKEIYPIVCCGSVMEKSEIVRCSFLNYIKNTLPKYEVIFPRLTQVYGQVLCAAKNILTEMDYECFYNNIFSLRLH